MNSPVARSVQMNGRFTGGVYVDRVVANEMGVAKERLQVILREARADMELTASKDDISIIEMERVVQLYAEFPSDVDGGRDALRKRMADDIRTATDELVTLRQGQDIEAIESAIKAWNEKGGTKLAVPLNDLREHRRDFYPNHSFL